MFRFILLLLLSGTFPTSHAFSTGLGDDPFSTASLTVTCLFSLVFLLQITHCLIIITAMREHRLPYLTLFPAIAVTTVASIATIPAIVTFTTPAYALFIFARNWSAILVFIAIMAFLCDRETTICDKPRTNRRRNNARVAVHVTFVVLMFIFATARCSALVNLQLAVDKNPMMTMREFNRRANTADAMNYVSVALYTLSSVDVVITAILLSKAAKSRGISDKVTNTVLYAISPLYALLTLSRLAFVVVFSPVGPSSAESLGGADLARDVILYLLTAAIFWILLFLSNNRASWDSWSPLPSPTTQQEQQYQPHPLQPDNSQPYEMQPPSPQKEVVYQSHPFA